MPALIFEQPAWMNQFAAEKLNLPLNDPAEQILIANQLARLNVINKTGGPFGAIVVDMQTGKVAGWGVNCVTTYGSIFHAEIVALWQAQKNLGTYDLGGAATAPHCLVVSSSPCSMCLGAVLWSGVRQLVTGATTADVQSITGFDEGPIPDNLSTELEKRGINLIAGIHRVECQEVLSLYKKSGGEIYNGGRGFRGGAGL